MALILRKTRIDKATRLRAATRYDVIPRATSPLQLSAYALKQ